MLSRHYLLPDVCLIFFCLSFFFILCDLFSRVSAYPSTPPAHVNIPIYCITHAIAQTKGTYLGLFLLLFALLPYGILIHRGPLCPLFLTAIFSGGTIPILVVITSTVLILITLIIIIIIIHVIIAQ